ncbi:MAG: holo-[acyl-carrier-protein] synthase [Calditrichaeota bacterium]|nr:MAG: holo-[acyl-carrier-protein] synthase [Calditrichota bacterium]
MNTYGVGIDIVEIARIDDLIKRYGERFLNRVFTPGEIAYCLKKVTSPQSFAARFAAKEAIFKATGIGVNLGIHWKDVEVLNDKWGKPIVHLTGKTAQLLKDKHISISLSHTDTIATAMVVIDENGKK